MVAPRTMPGVLELLPAEQVVFQRMVDTIRSVYARFGFVPIETPAIELTDVLLTKTGGETERQVYFVQSTGALEQGRDPELALRYDLTVPLARYVAEHQHDLVFPFRRYQIQRVYRGESPQRGRFREFVQCDIDVIGRDHLSIRHDAEMPAVIERVFTELGIGPFTIRLNNRRLMRGILASQGLADPDVQAGVLREIDKLDKRGRSATIEALESAGVPSRQNAEVLLDLVSRRSESHADALAILDDLEGLGPQAEEGLEEMRTVLDTVRMLGVPEDRYALDLSIARGLDYYTGTVYETVLDEHPEVGSICSGGRYDDLASHYTSARLPGVGISIGLTRLYWQLREIGLLEVGPSPTTVYVTVMDQDGLSPALVLAGTLRDGGINAEVALEPDRLAKQLRYADRAGIRFAIIAGEDERDRGVVTVKDLREGTQLEVSPAGLVAALHAALEPPDHRRPNTHTQEASQT
ncbi:MAG TPA: histidine--tRNA ligase [Acidimicrobiia bacterium]